MVDSEKWNVSDDVAQLEFDQPVLGGHQGAEVVQQAERDSSVVRLQKKPDKVFDARQRQPDRDGGRLFDQHVLKIINDD
jgi:hypothetical protein